MPSHRVLSSKLSIVLTGYQLLSVMPLQHLMQPDAIEETAQSEAEEDAGRNRKMAACGADGYGHRTANAATQRVVPAFRFSQQRLAACRRLLRRDHPAEPGRGNPGAPPGVEGGKTAVRERNHAGRRSRVGSRTFAPLGS